MGKDGIEGAIGERQLIRAAGFKSNSIYSLLMRIALGTFYLEGIIVNPNRLSRRNGPCQAYRNCPRAATAVQQRHPAVEMGHKESGLLTGAPCSSHVSRKASIALERIVLPLSGHIYPLLSRRSPV